MKPATLLRSAAIGAVTGARMMTGVAAVARTTPWRPRVTRTLTLAAAGELVGDKLPQTPPRTEPPGLAGRAVTGGLAAAALARRGGETPVLPALVGTLTAVAYSFAGVRARKLTAAKLGSDLPGALAEDAFAVGAAIAVCRR